MSKVVVLLHFADPSFQAATPTKKTPPKPRVGNEEKLKPTSELLYTLVCIHTVVSYLIITDFPKCLSQCRIINKKSHLAKVKQSALRSISKFFIRIFCGIAQITHF